LAFLAIRQALERRPQVAGRVDAVELRSLERRDDGLFGLFVEGAEDLVARLAVEIGRQSREAVIELVGKRRLERVWCEAARATAPLLALRGFHVPDPLDHPTTSSLLERS